jgi:hypothetical protein
MRMISLIFLKRRNEFPALTPGIRVLKFISYILYICSALLWFFYSLFLDALLEKRIIEPHRKAAAMIISDIPVSGEDNLYLENRSVRENIMFGNIRATEEEYNRAYDTAMIDDKVYLSRSMKQRVTLARRLISNPKSIDLNKELSICDFLLIRDIEKNIKINYPEINLQE